MGIQKDEQDEKQKVFHRNRAARSIELVNKFAGFYRDCPCTVLALSDSLLEKGLEYLVEICYLVPLVYHSLWL